MNMILRSISKMALPVAFVGLSLLSGLKANAQAITPTLTGTSTVGGITTFTYDIVLGSDSTASNSTPVASLTLFDFAGLTGTPVFTGVGGANFAVTTPLAGTNFANPVIGQVDNPLMENIVLTYTGVNNIVNTSTTATITLGTLTAQSTGTPTGQFTPFSSISQKTSNGSVAANQSFVLGPTAVPEPGSVAMLIGMGISGSVFLRRKRSK